MLALNIPDREVRFEGLPLDIARDEKTRKAWADSKDIVTYYTRDVIEDQKDAVSIRMYKKPWEGITDAQRSAVKSSITETALARDPEARAWMYWWGRSQTPTSTTAQRTNAAALRLLDGLRDDYGPGHGATSAAQIIGESLSEGSPRQNRGRTLTLPSGRKITIEEPGG